MNKTRLSAVVLAILGIQAAVAAPQPASEPSFKMVGTVDATIKLTPLKAPGNRVARGSAPQTQKIKLMKMELSDQAKQYFANLNYRDLVAVNRSTQTATSSSRVNLGMNGVPVLNQGQHGTCVTFAVSAAIDAAVGSTDQVSQLCSLELGSYLAARKIIPYSGWEGSFGSIVLNQYKKYDAVTMDYQRQNGCEGVFEYPKNSALNTGAPMPTEDYQSVVKQEHRYLANGFSYKTILGANESYSSHVNMTQKLEAVKSALGRGHRVVFGTGVYVGGRNRVGIYGSYRAEEDTWVLTQEILNNLKNNKKMAGHEMVIIGYDDTATVRDPSDEVHTGILTLRNSWSADAGDQGNYYMTYDYFKTLVDEAHEIIPTNANLG